MYGVYAMSVSDLHLLSGVSAKGCVVILGIFSLGAKLEIKIRKLLKKEIIGRFLFSKLYLFACLTIFAV